MRHAGREIFCYTHFSFLLFTKKSAQGLGKLVFKSVISFQKDKPESFSLALSDKLVRQKLGRCVGAESYFPTP